MSLARDLGTVGSATLASRVLALVRDMGVAAALGAGPLADAYVAALQVPNLFRRLLADGALNGALVPLWLRRRGDGRSFAERIFGVTLVALGGFALLGIAFAPAAIHLVAPGFGAGTERFADAVLFLRLAMAYVAFAGIAAVAVAILNAEGRVAAASAGIVAFNVVLVAAALVVLALGTGASRLSAGILAASFAVAGVVQLALILAALRRLPRPPRRARFALSDDVRRFYARAVPALVAGGIPQLALIAGTIVASPSVTAVSWLYYACRLYELPLGVVSGAVASVLAPRLARAAHAGDDKAVAAAQTHAVEVALGLALPAACGLALLARPIAGVLFERGAFTPADTAAVAAAIAAIAFGLPGHALEKVLAAVSFANEDTRTPMLTAALGLAASVVAALALFPRYGHVGVAAAIAMAGWVGALALALARRGRLRARPRALRIVAAAAVMSLGLLAAMHALGAAPRLLVVVLLVPLGAALYAASLAALRVVSPRDLYAAAKQWH